jgi:hypothetical protein
MSENRSKEEPMSNRSSPVFNQVNIVGGDPDASLRFYRKLGLEIPDNATWRAQTGAHHITAQRLSGSEATDLDIDSAAFARVDAGWRLVKP